MFQFTGPILRGDTPLVVLTSSEPWDPRKKLLKISGVGDRAPIRRKDVHDVSSQRRIDVHDMPSQRTSDVHSVPSQWRRKDIHDVLSQRRIDVHDMPSQRRSDVHGVPSQWRNSVHDVSPQRRNDAYDAPLERRSSMHDVPPQGMNGSDGMNTGMGTEEQCEDMILRNISPPLVECDLYQRAIKSVRVGCNAVQTERHSPATAETMSRLWGIGPDTAQQMMRMTTQQGICTVVHPISWRYRVDHLHFHWRHLNTTFHTDTLFSKVQSLRGHKCAHVIMDGKFTTVYLLQSKAQAGNALHEFINNVGIPDSLVADLAGEHTGTNTEFQ